mgnify:CR=1 FL=1
MNQIIKIGDKIKGGRLEKYYAIVEGFKGDNIIIRYNGDIKTFEVTRETFNRIK